ncbi:YfhO family protein [Candidatus Sumerlaeota bacterium]|nr:YfhO family protein [Candidatus Sumerlaeota bacterium]
MTRNKKEVFLAALFIFTIALGLHLNLFQEGLSVDERANQNLPDRVFNARSLRQGVLPLWNPYVFWGNPHIATHQSAFFYPSNLVLFLLLPPVSAMKFSTLLHGFLAGLFMFFYLKRLRMRTLASVAGSLAFMMSGYFLSHEGHTANRDSIVWIPLLFFFVEGVLEKQKRMDFLGGALTFAVMIFSGYMHTVVFTGFFVVFYMAIRIAFSFRNRARRAIPAILGTLFLGGGIAAVQILTTGGILDQTVRGKITYETFSSGYFPFSYLPLLFFPYLFGANYTYSAATRYCGIHNLEELTGWMDGLFIVLGILGFLCMRRGKRRTVTWSWAFLGVLSFILCFGPENPLYRYTFLIPGYKLFKGPAKNWLGVHIALSVLSAFGLHYLLVLLKKRPRIFRRTASYISLALFFIGFSLSGFILTLRIFHVQTWRLIETSSLQDYIAWGNPAVWIPICALFFEAIIFSIFAFSKRKTVLLLCLPPLLLQALFLKHNMYIHPQSLENIYQYPDHNAVYSFLKQREGNFHGFRIYPARLFIGDGVEEVLYPCINQIYGIRSLAGYGPLFHKDYSMISHIHSTGISFRFEHQIKQNRILSMLNARYIIIFPTTSEHKKHIGFLEETVSHPGGEPFYKEIFRSPLGVRVYENLKACPQAYSVSRIFIPEELAQNPGDVKAYHDWFYKWTTRFDPREEALFMEPIPDDFPAKFAPARVNIEQFQSDRFIAEVEAEDRAFVVFSEMYHPGWRVYLNGQRVKPYRVNIFMNGLPVPQGRHRIVFRYLPQSFFYGLILSCLSLALLVVLLYLWNPERSAVCAREKLMENRSLDKSK